MRLILFYLISILLVNCSSNNEDLRNFRILPSVKEIKYNNGYSNLNFKNIKFAYCEIDTNLPIRYGFTKEIQSNSLIKSVVNYSIDNNLNLNEEGYKLNIKKNIITIVAKDIKGLFYAFITLDQIIEDSKAQNTNLPLINITDFPSLKFRPIHLDIKHHMEKKSYYFKLIDDLAKQKINGIIVEFEDKLKYELRPEIGASDALSINWWIELSEYASKRNISISPLVQGLGHASFILKHEKNKKLRDIPTSDWAFNPLNPKTYELQFDLYLDAIKATPNGKYLHVGGDEVNLLKRQGKSELELNLIWLNKVCEFAAIHNRIPIFWDDMPLKHAGLYGPMFNREISKKEVDDIWEKNELNLMSYVEKFPKNAIYMRWNYQKSDTYGNLKTMDWYMKNNLKVMGATAGQTRWTLMPQNQSNIPQIKSFATSSIEKNLEGLFLTLWDDDSPHFELYKRGISAFSQYSWSGNKTSISEFKEIYRHRKYGLEFADNKFAFIDKLETPVSLWLNMLLEDNKRRSSLSKIKDPIQSAIILLPNLENSGSWSTKYADKIQKANKSLQISKEVDSILNYLIENNSKNIYNLEIYKQVNELVKFSSKIIITLEKLDSSDSKTTTLLQVNNLINEFNLLRTKFEKVYSKTRILNKPKDYILDQDHHDHPANQTKNFDWQFLSEIFILKKIRNNYNKS